MINRWDLRCVQIQRYPIVTKYDWTPETKLSVWIPWFIVRGQSRGSISYVNMRSLWFERTNFTHWTSTSMTNLSHRLWQKMQSLRNLSGDFRTAKCAYFIMEVGYDQFLFLCFVKMNDHFYWCTHIPVPLGIHVLEGSSAKWYQTGHKIKSFLALCYYVCYLRLFRGLPKSLLPFGLHFSICFHSLREVNPVVYLLAS
jgi:hypothetical protein